MSRLLLVLQAESIDTKFWTVNYRGYWRSYGSPSEVGLNIDVASALQHIYAPSLKDQSLKNGRDDGAEAEEEEEVVVIWGHSIGAALAIQALPTLFNLNAELHGNRKRKIRLVLETPFDSLKSVMLDMYPQRWLPYKYLHSFLRSRLGSVHSLSLTAAKYSDELDEFEVLVLVAGSDEIVSRKTTDVIVKALKSSIGAVKVEIVKGGLHQDLIGKRETQQAIVDFMQCKR